eukprot:CAMPEP_0175065356 /NCGR_PEP_ID=MMETSP0052_2-20121109/15875_1 /TAXON_ID=51329 ORGANISM="Polytomella parva, Strain SAG 63-3" /NCGR_SAMPLE_ID=MMETSP0052_2 /ASSEMBLY_ACC=CAM_ASM_000194 /LENGTH=276 /DNA_ID=CAMNT_0016331873 /DNA_START=1338 /DNA_END=2165 /DNA_ORIENTATION=+
MTPLNDHHDHDQHQNGDDDNNNDNNGDIISSVRRRSKSHIKDDNSFTFAPSPFIEPSKHAFACENSKSTASSSSSSGRLESDLLLRNDPSHSRRKKAGENVIAPCSSDVDYGVNSNNTSKNLICNSNAAYSNNDNGVYYNDDDAYSSDGNANSNDDADKATGGAARKLPFSKKWFLRPSSSPNDLSYSEGRGGGGSGGFETPTEEGIEVAEGGVEDGDREMKGLFGERGMIRGDDERSDFLSEEEKDEDAMHEDAIDEKATDEKATDEEMTDEDEE